MKIIKYEISYKNELQNLINSIYDQEAPNYILSLKEVLIAFQDNKIIGFATYRHSDLHHKVVTVEIGISRTHRRSGIGTKLHKELLSAFPLTNKVIGLDGCAYEENKSAQYFLSSLCYKAYLDCNILIIDLEKELDYPMQAEVKTLNDLYKETSFKHKLRSFYIARYSEEHKWSPVTMEDVTWDDYYDDGNALDLSVALTKDNQIIGCSFAYENFGKELEEENDNLLGIGGTYTAVKSLENEITLTKCLLSFQMELARTKGHKEAYLEIDSTESTSSELLRWLPIKKKRIYKRFRLQFSDL